MRIDNAGARDVGPRRSTGPNADMECMRVQMEHLGVVELETQKSR